MLTFIIISAFLAIYVTVGIITDVRKFHARQARLKDFSDLYSDFTNQMRGVYNNEKG